MSEKYVEVLRLTVPSTVWTDDHELMREMVDRCLRIINEPEYYSLRPSTAHVW